MRTWAHAKCLANAWALLRVTMRWQARGGVLKTIMLLGACVLAAGSVAHAAEKLDGEDYSRLSVAQLTAKAEKGDAQAQFLLGRAHAIGDGVPKDAVEAAKWYRHAAEQGNAIAQNNLGAKYAAGVGVPKDFAEAVKWWRKAAGQGLAAAQHNLGVSYENGDGVPKDYVEAYKWANLAAAQGNANGKKLRDGLENKMAPEQIAEGQRLAREFKAKP